MKILENYSFELEKIYSNEFVESIILFGSQNNDTANQLSDIDICIITNRNINSNQRIEILQYCDDILDISLFDELPLSAQSNVVRNGKILKTKSDITTLKINIINQYRDFKPRLNRIYKAKGLLAIE